MGMRCRGYYRVASALEKDSFFVLRSTFSYTGAWIRHAIYREKFSTRMPSARSNLSIAPI